MASYAIGDIQGCYHAFNALLARLKFNPKHDKLWLVGDLINRGSGSLEVLRWCYQHQQSLRIVLGNHDLHALAVVHHLKSAHKSDTLQASIDAPDSDALFTWLRHQSLMHAEDGYVMVHAGLLPQWSVEAALIYAREVECALQADSYLQFLANMYGNMPNQWQPNLTGMDRLRIITNAMTRMRICTEQGEMEFAFKGELQDTPNGYTPWFDVPFRQSQAAKIICGHWSALGLRHRDNIYALDTGCLWGGQLTAMCLETQKITQVNHDARDHYVRDHDVRDRVLKST
jgi:bis(5'-nucleosyl)-tetraphosphatase (symmetrical)